MRLFVKLTVGVLGAKENAATDRFPPDLRNVAQRVATTHVRVMKEMMLMGARRMSMFECIVFGAVPSAG